MSEGIIKEVIFLAHSLLLGVGITFVYDWFLILRRLWKHTSWLVSLEDVVFWIGCAISVFWMLYEENNGILRWFAVTGAALGMLLYKKTVSGLIIRAAVRAGTLIKKLLLRVIAVLLCPIRFVLKKLGAGCKTAKYKSSRMGRRLKKKLTAYGKVLKMVVRKQ